ncbi:MAG: hypothetical protein U0165_02980 [Polyangiaceae bacterium]
MKRSTFSTSSLFAFSFLALLAACGGTTGERDGSNRNGVSSGDPGDPGGTGGTAGDGVGGGISTGGGDPGGSDPGGSAGASNGRSGIALFRYQLDNSGAGGDSGGTAGIGGSAGVGGSGVGTGVGGTGGSAGDGGWSGSCGGPSYVGGSAGAETGGTGGIAGSDTGGSAGVGGFNPGGSGGVGGSGPINTGGSSGVGGFGAGGAETGGTGSGGAPDALNPMTLFVFVDSTNEHQATQCWAPFEALPCSAWRVTIGIEPELVSPGSHTYSLSTPGINAFFSSTGPGADPNSCEGWGGGSFTEGSITLNFDGSSTLSGSFSGTSTFDFDANGSFEVSWCP